MVGYKTRHGAPQMICQFPNVLALRSAGMSVR